MPRTLPAALTAAMDSGEFVPYLKALISPDDPENPLAVDVLGFKITDVTPSVPSRTMPPTYPPPGSRSREARGSKAAR